LLEDADVVVQNYRKGKLDKLGLSYEEVRKRKPDIVYASMNAYGHEGPWADRPGHEQLAQAATGMQERYGGDGTPTLQPHAVNDYGTGYMGAFGVALSLFHKERTGQGQHVDSALAYTALALQSRFFQEYEGKKWDEPRGLDAVGEGPLYRAYQANDGWFFLAARRSDLPRLAAIEGLAGVDEQTGEALEKSLEERFAGDTVDAWVARLVDAGLAAHRVMASQRAIMDDPRALANGLSMTREHDEIGPVVTSGPGVRLSRTPIHAGRPAPKPGADAREILEEAGVAERYVEFLQRGIIRIDGVAAG
jgi:crotonobetainyl-CoA:carnitine CoA-transferase CaiB-like acyl-CoA transferase